MAKPLGELTDADKASVVSVVAHRQAGDSTSESWDVSLFSLASDSPVATDVVGLLNPVSSDQITEHVVFVLGREGLKLEQPWRSQRDGYFMSGVVSLDSN
ncbi:hypothetical protein [Leifsonia poae]|uniref:hypothetical protein n=1 Tax=Leifsonia poae TaxID=110933 RepID=UPI001CBB4933|nr:hypothetical protein [Leifsonia poae]